MMNNSNIKFVSKSNNEILLFLGKFIRHHRLEQDKTQAEVAEAAGINRSTLSEFERGTRVNMVTFLQLLRVLDLLDVLDAFEIEEKPVISPLQLAKLTKKKRQRASGAGSNQIENPGVDW